MSLADHVPTCTKPTHLWIPISKESNGFSMQGFFTVCFAENREQNIYFTQKPQVEINYFFIKTSLSNVTKEIVYSNLLYITLLIANWIST
jgi:hypothetical protein